MTYGLGTGCSKPGCPGIGSLEHEFPDYPVEDLPQVPSWLHPAFWHNDACPIWSDGANQADCQSGIMLAVDFRDPARRECGGDRYSVWWADGVGGREEGTVSSDDFLVVLAELHGLTRFAEPCIRR